MVNGDVDHPYTCIANVNLSFAVSPLSTSRRVVGSGGLVTLQFVLSYKEGFLEPVRVSLPFFGWM